jgi:hypothetical protein
MATPHRAVATRRGLAAKLLGSLTCVCACVRVCGGLGCEVCVCVVVLVLDGLDRERMKSRRPKNEQRGRKMNAMVTTVEGRGQGYGHLLSKQSERIRLVEEEKRSQNRH